MSDSISLPAPPPSHSPLPPPPAETPPVVPPSPAPIQPVSSFKPLLNPLQSVASPAASTIAEPPRSPNPANEATDDRGVNVDLPALTAPPEPAAGPAEIPSIVSDVREAVVEAAPVPQVNLDVEMAKEENWEKPPLPTDAPVPASPAPPHDEVKPSVVAAQTQPISSTPSIIATEDVIMDQAPPSIDAPVSSQPTLNGSASQGAFAPSAPAPLSLPTPTVSAPPPPPPAPTPVEPEPTAQAPTHPPLSNGMEIDGEGEEDLGTGAPMAVDPVGTNGHAGSKRAGEELAGSDEKRRQTQAQSPFQAPAAPISAGPPFVSSQPAPAQPPAYSAPPAPYGQQANPPLINAPVTFVPLVYHPPPHRDPGPTTPLTQTQHKHLLNAVRSLKKNKDAVNFLYPVDIVLFGIPHYAQIVRNPMDLGTVETKLVVSNPRGPPKDKSKMGNWDTSKGSYRSVSEITQDVRQIWENTRMFNGPDHVVSQMATRLEAIYEKALATIPAEYQSYTPMASPASFVEPAAPSAGPSNAHARRASISQPPAPRRSSDNIDRPKREIHPPPSKELPYANDQGRKKRRPDAQINYLAKQIRLFETKNADLAGPFLYPVEEIVAALPDYLTVIKKPIDLNHIKAKINEGDYEEAKQLNSDFRMMCQNAMKFNPPSHDVHIAAARFLKLWEEKWKALPPKEVPVVRSYSEDPIAEDLADGDDDDFEDDPTIIMLREQIATMESKIEQIKTERRKNRPPRPSKKAKAPRKQSVSHIQKASPGANGNGYAQPQKQKKKKDVSYHEDNGFAGEESGEEEVSSINLTQKQELAEKITQVDGATLQKAIDLIAKSTGLDGTNEEIELDIDTLPPRTVVQLYNLVCRGRTPSKKAGRPKQPGGGGVIPGKKPGRKPGKKHMNEQEEAERIKRMEAQLQSFGGGGGGGGGGSGMGGQQGGYDDSESSDDEESEED